MSVDQRLDLRCTRFDLGAHLLLAEASIGAFGITDVDPVTKDLRQVAVMLFGRAGHLAQQLIRRSGVEIRHLRQRKDGAGAEDGAFIERRIRRRDLRGRWNAHAGDDHGRNHSALHHNDPHLICPAASPRLFGEPGNVTAAQRRLSRTKPQW